MLFRRLCIKPVACVLFVCGTQNYICLCSGFCCKQCTYNVTLRRVRVTIVAMENQNISHILRVIRLCIKPVACVLFVCGTQNYICLCSGSCCKQCTYNVTLRRVRVTIVAMENQNISYSACDSLFLH